MIFFQSLLMALRLTHYIWLNGVVKLVPDEQPQMVLIRSFHCLLCPIYSHESSDIFLYESSWYMFCEEQNDAM